MAPFRPSLPTVLLLAAFMALPGSLASQSGSGAAGGASSSGQAADSAAVAAAVQAFHEALRTGDEAAARALLADDLRVAESGGMENRSEYLSHHLPADMAFAAAVDRTLGPIHVTVEGNVAWTMSTSHTAGTYRGRAIDSRGAELMVLTRDGDAWRIRAIHWSSRQAG